MGLKLFLKEIANVKSLFSRENKESRSIVFYSESSIYYLYFEWLILYILDNSKQCVCYITSDPDDPVFLKQTDRFNVFYISNTIMAFVTLLLDSKVLIMTMPDLNKYHIKRSKNNVNHIYVFHAIISAHMAYQKGAFDHYDTVFCVGPHHVEEIIETEFYYGLNNKELVEVGYPLLEKIHKEHYSFKERLDRNTNTSPMILIAPSWAAGNIIETCIEEIVSLLLGAGYRVVLRPHPETFKRNKEKINSILEKYKDKEAFEIDDNLCSINNFHMADILITDWSGIAFEYAFGTERPVLFINTPKKIHNDEYDKLGLEPIEIKLRNIIGISIDVREINTITTAVCKLLSEHIQFKKAIIEQRNKYIYNWNHSFKVGGEYILQYIKNA